MVEGVERADDRLSFLSLEITGRCQLSCSTDDDSRMTLERKLALPIRRRMVRALPSKSAPQEEPVARVEYRKMTCKSALNRVQGKPLHWSPNPFRGCVHHCRFCFASPTHRYFELAGVEDFFGIIFAKANLPEVLAEELSRRSWRREQVAVGTATDPYQPAEGRYRLTRRCLELFAHFRTPISLVTKGAMVLRDLDVLQELTRCAGSTICFSVPTVDAEIWRRTELGTPPPWQRFRVMERLVAGGIHAGVLMAPLLPGLSANPDQIERTVHAAADHGARFIGSNLLHLDAGIRDFFLSFLEGEYPELLDGYRRLSGTRYAPKAYPDAGGAPDPGSQDDRQLRRRPPPPGRDASGTDAASAAVAGSEPLTGTAEGRLGQPGSARC